MKKLRTQDEEWYEFLTLLTELKTKEMFLQFFDLFLTLDERETLRQRFLIIRSLLKQKIPQRELSKKTKVSIAQITRGSNALKIINPKLKDFLIKTL